MFHPLSKLPDIVTNLEFLAKNRIGSYDRVVNKLELYPGAPLAAYFRRKGVELSEERYRLYYDFLDPAVVVLYESFRKVLKPFNVLEEKYKRIIFDLVNEPSRGSPPVQETRRLGVEISSQLVEVALICAAMVGEGKDPVEAKWLGEQVSQRVERLSISLGC